MIDVEKFIAGLHEYLARAFRPVVDRLAAVESRLDQLEARDLESRLARLVAEGEQHAE